MESGCVLAGYDDSGGPNFDNKVVYSYTVAGRRFQGNCIEALAPVVDREHADQVAASYPVGKEVVVYYDPAAPERAVLVPGIAPATKVMLLVYLAVCLLLFMEMARKLF